MNNKEQKVKNKRGAAARRKGHSFEREIANLLKPMFPYVATTRAESKLLDDCLIDLCNLPFNIQCKAGYSTHRPNYIKLKEETAQRLKDKIPEGHMLASVVQNPFILFHKDGRDTTVTMTADMFLQLLKNVYKSENDNAEVISNDEKLDKIDQDIID